MIKSIRILMLEEQEADADIIEKELRQSGIEFILTWVRTKEDFVLSLANSNPDIVLSDYIVTNFEGLEALELVKTKSPSTPFIFVSWLIHESSVIDTLKKGATDYVFKDHLWRLTLSVHRALREIEEHKELGRAQTELKQSEAHFRSLIENASDIITILDEDGRICYESPSLKKVLGYDPEEVIGKDCLEYIHKDDLVNTTAAFEEMIKTPNKPVAVEFRFLHKNGSWPMIEAIGKNVPDEKGRVKIVLNSRDVTDRYSTEEALKENTLRYLKTQAELQKTQQRVIDQERLGALGQMASGIAHDFNNTLFPVLGFCEILLNHPENLDDKKKVTEYLSMINTAALDAKHVVGRLREFYRLRKEGEVFTTMKLKDVVEQAVRFTQPKWKDQALANGRTISVEMEMNGVEVLGNDSSLREALTNLIFNAVDAMPSGGTIRFHSFSEDGFQVLEITDNGTGMTEEVQKRCFDPFFSTKGKNGTGLGLAMVYGIIRRHEGSIDIRSKLGAGSTFIIRLPLKKEGKDAPPKPPKPAPVKLSKITRPLRVLLVDDELAVHEVMKEYLRSDGHSMVSAMNGKEGLEKFKAGKYDLIVTDWAMPEMNGEELATQIKKISPQTPLIMLTGFGELMKAKGERSGGVDLLLSKPLSIEEFHRALSEIFPRG